MPEPSITTDPNIMMGKPVIQGTRITVELIMGKVIAGQTIEEILADYPHLTREGVVAALEFALDLVKLARFYPLPTDKVSA